ncbi:MAG TPA: ATP-binding cassette domain-containing protein [Acidimicrobiales bacterium]|jgi:ABC-2 type transport system ATP-binding protein|nr:ATP-binding cassette domain-containing protein [Acidimicrobiales bacterium]
MVDEAIAGGIQPQSQADAPLARPGTGTASPPRPAVVVDSLVKTFKGGVRALDGVSFEIPTGTVLGLLGPNGAGKTTAVHVLTTLLRPDSGSAHVAGIDVLANPEEARKHMGLAGQFAAVDEGLTGMENLVLVGRLNHLPRSERRSRALELLEQFDLADAGGRLLKTYSGGMRRRLDLAAALVAQPPVLFLDEPTTGLDPRSRIDLWAVIAGLVADGTTLLLTTQYLEEADRLANTICVIDHGRVIAEGTAAELKSRLGGTTVEVVLPDSDTAARALAALAGVGDGDPVVDGLTVRLATTTGLATTSELVRRLEGAGLDVSSLQLRQPSLDDVFLSLTGQDPHADEDEDDNVPAGRRGIKTGRGSR